MAEDDMSMGKYEEMYAMLQNAGVENIPKRTHWVTRSGKRIPIRLMTDTYLVNCLHFLMHRLRCPCESGGECLNHTIDAGTSIEERIAREWPELVEEAAARGLKW